MKHFCIRALHLHIHYLFKDIVVEHMIESNIAD